MDARLDVDEIWRSLGTWGRYQKTQIGICLITYFPVAFQLLLGVFIGIEPNYRCSKVEDMSSFNNTSDDENETYFVNYDKCHIDIYHNTTNGTSPVSRHDCPNGISYSVPKDWTYVAEWDIVCSTGLAEFSQTLIVIGQAVGAVLTTSLADRFGRKTINLTCQIAILGFGVGIAFVPNFTAFLVLKFLIGIFQQGAGLTAAILLLETLPKECRFLSEVLGLLIWTTAVSAMAPVAYFLRNFPWRYTQIAFSLFPVYSLIQYWIQEESLRWLLINGKLKEAERVLRKAARMNHVNFDDVISAARTKMVEQSSLTRSFPVSSDHENHDVKNDEKKNLAKSEPEGKTKVAEQLFKVQHYSILTLLKEKQVLIISLIMWFTWITDSLTYYGLTLTATSLAGNRYLNFFLTAAAEYPAALIEYLSFNRLGRKITCIMFHLIAMVSLVIATVSNYFADGSSTLVTVSRVFTFFGKMGIAGSFSTVFLYTPELYPTNLRNAGIGFASAAARIGGMIAPFSSTLAEVVPWGPGAIFSIMCTVVTLSLWYLPETARYELPQTMDELKSWYKQHSGAKRKKRTNSAVFRNNVVN